MQVDCSPLLAACQHNHPEVVRALLANASTDRSVTTRVRCWLLGPPRIATTRVPVTLTACLFVCVCVHAVGGVRVCVCVCVCLQDGAGAAYLAAQFGHASVLEVLRVEGVPLDAPKLQVRVYARFPVPAACVGDRGGGWDGCQGGMQDSKEAG
jgi:hypothetical protein